MKIQNFIGGTLREPSSDNWLENINPATGAVYGSIIDSDETDLEQAVTAATKAFPAWRDTPASTRAACLNKLADLIELRLAEFALAECIDNGKPLSLTKTVDIPRAIANLRAFAAVAGEISAGSTLEKPDSRSFLLRQPHGVVSTISPWNLPLLLFTWKLAPALAAGNCVIAKPSEVTPMTAYLLSTLANDAGFPPGVLNVLHGRGAQIGSAITNHPGIPVISFTGGTKTGAEIYSGAAKHLKKVSLELGGKNPTIIFGDADLNKAVDGAIAAAFTNQGQICLCGSRLLVHNVIYDRFKSAFLLKTQSIKIGDPLAPDTQHGAMVSKAHMEKVLDYIELAKKEGGKILIGGDRRILEGRCKNGYFIEPTVIEGLPASCRTNQEEIFGPVVTLIPFDNEDDALTKANSTEYGLAASIWTADKSCATRMAKRVESGIVWLNCWNLRDLDTPFGGMKRSGIGREGIRDSMYFFTQQKTVTEPVLTDKKA